MDDVVRELVGELVAAAAGEWRKQCLEGQAVELIVEHVSAMSLDNRLAAYSALLLQLGPRDGEPTESRADGLLRLEVLKRCFWVFWGRFPRDVFALLVVLVRRALRLDEVSEEEEELPDVGPTGVRGMVKTTDVTLALQCIAVFWVIARDKFEAGGQQLEEALSGLEAVVGGGQIARPETSDDLARISLDAIVLPLLGDVLITLCAKDPTVALDELPLVEGSPVWRDAFACESVGSRTLAELEWFLVLCQKHARWVDARECEEARRTAAGPERRRLLGFGRAAWEDEGVSKTTFARDELLDWARPRLAQDRPFLEPSSGTHTTLPEGQWQRLSSTLASRVLFLLLSVFEGPGDFNSALSDLAVAVAHSPWMLQQLAPRHARVFLQRLALLPNRPGALHLPAASA